MLTTFVSVFLLSIFYERYCNKMLFNHIDLKYLRANDWITMSRPFGVIFVWHKYKHYAK